MNTAAAALCVAAGGAVGSLLRWGTGVALISAGPWPTVAINVLGSLVIGVLAGWPNLPAWVSPLLIAGLCGGFTTFSAYSLHTLNLWQEQRYAACAVYAFASVALSLLAVALGWWIARRLATG